MIAFINYVKEILGVIKSNPMKPHCPVRREMRERANKTSIGREYLAEGLANAKSQRQEYPDCL